MNQNITDASIITSTPLFS